MQLTEQTTNKTLEDIRVEMRKRQMDITTHTTEVRKEP